MAKRRSSPSLIERVEAIKRGEMLDRTAEVVEQLLRTKLRRQRSTRYGGRCPRHADQNPSLYVYLDHKRQVRIHCWAGCFDRRIDLVDLLRRERGMSFPQAVEEAERWLNVSPVKAGARTRRKSPAPAQPAREGTPPRPPEIIKALGHAKRAYHQVLKEDGFEEATKSLDYLKARGADARTIADYRIGYAPRGDPKEGQRARTLVNSIQTFSRNKSHYMQAGLVREINPAHASEKWFIDRSDPERGGYIDALAGNLVFPVHDEHGRIIGLYCRKPTEPGQGGHKVTTGTPQKSAFFGLHQRTRKRLARLRRAIVVEGPFDQIALQSLLKGEVVLGTFGANLSEEQAELLVRLGVTERLFLAYDMDEAGEKATRNAQKTMRAIAGAVQVLPVLLERAQVPPEELKRLYRPIDAKAGTQSLFHPPHEAAKDPDQYVAQIAHRPSWDMGLIGTDKWGRLTYCYERIVGNYWVSRGELEERLPPPKSANQYTRRHHIEGLVKFIRLEGGKETPPPDAVDIPWIVIRGHSPRYLQMGTAFILWLWVWMRQRAKRGWIKAADAEIADALGVTRQAVAQWRRKLEQEDLLTVQKRADRRMVARYGRRRG